MQPLDKKAIWKYIFKSKTKRSVGSEIAMRCSGNEDVSIIISESLVSALLAGACRQFPPELFEKYHYNYKLLATRALRSGLSSNLDEGDIFAANVLAWVAYSTHSDLVEVGIHMNGSMQMLKNLWILSRNGQKPLSDALKVFGSFIIDCASSWSAKNGAIPRRMTTFQQRVKYFDQLSRLVSGLGIRSAVREALHSTLGNLLELLLSGLSTAALHENAGDFSNRLEKNSILQYVEAEMGDVELYRALVSTKRAFQNTHDHKSVDEQWTLRLFHRLRCILLLHSILRSPTLSEGIDSVNTTVVAKSLISLLKSQSIPRGAPIQDYYLISWHNYSHLLLGGMALSNGGCPERNYPHSQRLTDSLFMGYSRAGTYWKI
jgi:hypothetical protein